MGLHEGLAVGTSCALAIAKKIEELFLYDNISIPWHTRLS
jgi:hypothetical protein